MSFKSKKFEFKVWGKYALFTDPITKTGGEKCSYHIPTYEAIKGITKSIYWKPTIIWNIDKIRIMKCIQTQTKGIKPRNYSKGGNTLSIYTFLSDVEYQVQAHFIWNQHQVDMKKDRESTKHHAMMERSLDRGGRQDIFLGVRDCQGYVEPCVFGEGKGFYDDIPELGFQLMFHGFDYPDETGENKLYSRFWRPKVNKGVLEFLPPKECTVRKYIRDMEPKIFSYR